MVDAISAGFAWVNPNSLSVRKLILILKKLKEMDEHPLRKGIDVYMKDSAGASPCPPLSLKAC